MSSSARTPRPSRRGPARSRPGGTHGPVPAPLAGVPADALATLVAVLDESTAPTAPPAAFAFSGPGPAGEGTVTTFAPSDLLGWTAGEDVVAVAVVAAGRARSVDQPPESPWLPAAGDPAPEGRGEPGPARVVLAVERCGGVAGRITLGGETRDEVPGGGRLYDALHRSMGLATDPPPAGTDRILVAVWLSAVLGGAAEDGRPLDWPAAVLLHPAAGVLAQDQPTAPPLPLLVDAVRAAGESWSWDVIRRVASRTGWLDELCPSELAGWMDAGMFARWTLAGLPPLTSLLAAARPALTVVAAAEMSRLLGPGLAP